MRYCQKCNNWLGGDSEFCPKCGSKTSKDGTVTKPISQVPTRESQFKKYLIGILAGFGALSILIIVIGVLLSANNRNIPKTSKIQAKNEMSFDEKLWLAMWEIKKDANQIRAEEQWDSNIRGRTIHWCGDVEEVREEIFGDDPIVILKSGCPYHSRMRIKVEFKNKNDVINLSKGNRICFQGTVDSYKEFLSDFYINNAEILSN